MAPATEILESAELLMGYKIGMSRPGHGPLLFIIGRAGIRVFEKNGERGAGGPGVKQSGNELRFVGFLAGGSALLHAALSPFDISRKIFRTQGQAGRTAVDGNPHEGSMRFAEDA